MSELCGAWLLSDGCALDRLAANARRAMLAMIEPSPVELDRGRLWIAAHREKLVETDAGLLGFEGFLAIGDRPLSEVIGDRDFEGHFVLARTDRAKTKLELLRCASGGERLYFVELRDLVLFSSSLRPLLAHPEIERRLDPDVARDVLLTGHPIRGSATPIRGIHEVLPGHTATVDREVVQENHCSPWLRSPEGSPARSAREFRARLEDGIARSIGPKRPVALALSGGIDSSAVAAALCEVVGPEKIHAFSYEFDDPTHSTETDFARRVARRLGIVSHEIFPIRFAEFLDAIPEHVFRSESAVHWPKAFLLPVARHVRSRGFDRYLTGFGIGSHMGYFGELARVLPWIPKPDFTLRYWSKVRFDGWDFFNELSRIHPGLEPPHPRLFHLLLEILEQRGALRDRRRLYPSELWPLLRERRDGPVGPLRRTLEREAFAHLVSCIDVTRSEKASRELGVIRISPAHFTRCLPYAYFPLAKSPPLWSASRRLRPGKQLLREAYRGVLPDEVLFRKKSWDDAVVSRAWRKRGRVFMLRALPHHPGDFERLGPGLASAVEAYEPSSIQAGCLAFRLWMKIFVERAPSVVPPTWRDLMGVDPMAARAHRAAPIELSAPIPFDRRPE